MPYYCTVPRCTSMAGKAKNVSFHQFPRDEELAKLWNRILKRGKPYTKYSKVCSLHFKPEDYTITSVGKNKGQWRTLRKDAVPSQNLPSESPAPYTRRSSGYWAPSQPSLVDPLLNQISGSGFNINPVQQQMAQAIYMQTMLAMQTAGASESLPADQPLQMPEPIKPSPSGSSVSEIELLLQRDTETTPKDVTYKCQECSKCFKDPDVFLLHKRTHKNDTNNIEKENYSANIQDREETLRANPILANLLKTTMRLEPESSISNILTVENQIMQALASNMEAYIRTLTSMLSNQANTETSDKCEDKSESEDYEDTRGDKCEDGDDSGKEKENDAEVESEDRSNMFRSRDDMCIDTNERDTPMNDDEICRDDETKDENNEVTCRRFSPEDTTYEKRDDMSIGENREHKSMDDNSTDETYKAHSNAAENQNYVSDDTSINDNDIREDDVQNDAHEHENDNFKTDDKIEDDTSRDEAYRDKIDILIEENHAFYNEDKIDEDFVLKTENHKHPNDEKVYDNIRNEAHEDKNDTREDDNDMYPSDDELDDNDTKNENKDIDKDGNLVQDSPDCDSIVDEIALNC